MISAILNGNPWLIPILLVTGLLLGFVMLLLARRHALAQLTAVAFGWALAGELVLTLYPVHSAASGGVCIVNRDLLGPLATQQGLLNIALFIPVTCLATLVFRRRAVILAAAVLLSAGTELLQSALPVLGRACTSEDLIANGLGAAIGSGVALVFARAGRSRRADAPHVLDRRDLLQGGKVLAVGTLASLVIGALTVTPVLAEVTELTKATPGQRRVAESMVRDVWGPQARISSVQYMAADPKTPGSEGQTLVTLEDGSLHFSDGAKFVSGSTSAKSIPGIDSHPVRTPEEGIVQATAFVRSRFPWALEGGSKVTAEPTAPGTGQFTVAWRLRKQDILMPMRMDVVVEADGRISAFTGRNEQGPAVLPPHHVTAQEAREAAQRKVPQGKFTESELVLKKNPAGEWATFWMIAFALPAPAVSPAPDGTEEVAAAPSGALLAVDAETGEVTVLGSTTDNS